MYVFTESKFCINLMILIIYVMESRRMVGDGHMVKKEMESGGQRGYYTCSAED